MATSWCQDSPRLTVAQSLRLLRAALKRPLTRYLMGWPLRTEELHYVQRWLRWWHRSHQRAQEELRGSRRR